MRIKEVARLSGLSEQSIRYYESRGLVIPDMEEKNGRLWRDYREEHVRLLSAVATLRRAYFHVEEIAELLEDPEKIPDTLREVRARIDENYAVLGKLRVRMNQEDVASAEDVLSLAERLNEAAAPLALPEGDVKYDNRAGNRDLREGKPLRRIFGLKLLAVLLIYWLLMMAAATVLLAGDIQRQARPVLTEWLESAITGARESFPEKAANATDAESCLTLPIQTLMPETSLPLLWKRPIQIYTGSMTMNEEGKIVSNAGFARGDGEDFQAGITMLYGKLSAIPFDGQAAYQFTWQTYVSLKTYLTFEERPLRKGSFPAVEYPGSKESGNQYQALQSMPTGNRTPAYLMDGLDSGWLHFDSSRLLQTAVLRGAWLRDGAGNPGRFVMGAYGFSPLLTAAVSLLPIYALTLGLLLLLAWFLCGALLPLVIRPLQRLKASLEEEPLQVSTAEFDFPLQASELQAVTSGYLLRRQMQEAARQLPEMIPAEACPALISAFRQAEGKLLPVLLDRGYQIRRELQEDGRIQTTPERLETALLALLRETIAYGESGKLMILTTRRKADFLLAEAEVCCSRHTKEERFYLLWNGVYINPASGDAPGVKLRKAAADIPGSFCAVRRTKTGLVLTLGLPQM